MGWLEVQLLPDSELSGTRRRLRAATVGGPITADTNLWGIYSSSISAAGAEAAAAAAAATQTASFVTGSTRPVRAAKTAALTGRIFSPPLR